MALRRGVTLDGKFPPQDCKPDIRPKIVGKLRRSAGDPSDERTVFLPELLLTVRVSDWRGGQVTYRLTDCITVNGAYVYELDEFWRLEDQ